jgi:hypothetical protein
MLVQTELINCQLTIGYIGRMKQEIIPVTYNEKIVGSVTAEYPVDVDDKYPFDIVGKVTLKKSELPPDVLKTIKEKSMSGSLSGIRGYTFVVEPKSIYTSKQLEHVEELL